MSTIIKLSSRRLWLSSTQNELDLLMKHCKKSLGIVFEGVREMEVVLRGRRLIGKFEASLSDFHSSRDSSWIHMAVMAAEWLVRTYKFLSDAGTFDWEQ